MELFPLFFSVHALLTCTSVYDIHDLCSHWRGCIYPRTWVTSAYMPTNLLCELNHSPLNDQQVLLITESSLQDLKLYFIWSFLMFYLFDILCALIFYLYLLLIKVVISSRAGDIKCYIMWMLEIELISSGIPDSDLNC